ncbi:MAG: hypothetical protein HY692_04450, partial [Cyanobacteria bacterium NC_groundwater_1444_Ag_S-0.65um_54_12]|nr:hypothetical protein [Cyanobacteria bacterium NC_groundwater_1444_Ag_S-0.65um_54_12]
MPTSYEVQLAKLVAYVKRLNQLVEERNQQLHYWQGYARSLREERQRLGVIIMGQIKRALGEVAGRYQEVNSRIAKQHQHLEHSGQLAKRKEITWQNRISYALSRIEDLSLERKAVRQELAEYKRRTWEAEAAARQLREEGASKISELETALATAFATNRQLMAELEDSQEQLAIQERQWQDLLG